MATDQHPAFIARTACRETLRRPSVTPFWNARCLCESCSLFADATWVEQGEYRQERERNEEQPVEDTAVFGMRTPLSQASRGDPERERSIGGGNGDVEESVTSVKMCHYSYL